MFVSNGTAKKHFGPWVRGFALVMASAAFVGVATQNVAAETRSFAFNWFYPAMYTQPDNCPDGVNPTSHEIFLNALTKVGKSPEEAERLIEQSVNGDGARGFKALTERGTFQGKPVNAYTNPLTVPDPGFKTAVGRYAFGFNLDGKGEGSPGAFEDPETHERGIDNQLFRIYGCLANYQALPPARPNYPLETWEMVRDSMPAWLLTINGTDLSKDGDVTITVDRALNHLLRDANSEARSNMTFRIDSDPRSHHQFPGEIRNGVLSAETPRMYLLGDQFFFPAFDFTQMHLRLTMNADGSAHGILGGYLPWIEVYFQHGANGLNAETFRGMDMVGLYRALMRLADADPDPATGQNHRISTAWWVELVPAFTIPSTGPTGSTLAQPSKRTPQGARR
jgi:hypothetical protein